MSFNLPGWRYLGGLAIPALLWLVFVYVLGDALRTRLRGAEEYDEAALREWVEESRVFREVVSGKQGQYELAVTVIQLSKPVFGFTFTVDMEAGWSLTRLDGGQVAFRKVIKSSHTATMSDAFAGVERLRLALEGAARENIRQGITAIAALDL